MDKKIHIALCGIVILLFHVINLNAQQIAAEREGTTVQAAFDLFAPYQSIHDIPNKSRYDIDTADVNRDGHPDIVTQSEDREFGTSNNDVLAWFPNNGDGTFGDKQLIDTVNQSQALDTGDLNNDGHTDLVTANDSLFVYMNGSDGAFTFGVSLDTRVEASEVFITDMNGDGNQDILLSDLSWYENQGDGTFGDAKFIEVPKPEITNVFPANINDDSYKDVIITSYNDGVIKLAVSSSDGTYSEQIISEQAYSTRDVYTSDLNENGNLDIVATIGGEAVWFENEGGSFAPKVVLGTTENNMYDITVSDLNDDGITDVVASSQFDDYVYWYPGKGNGAFGDSLRIEVHGPDKILTPDIDLDGDADILIGSRSDGVGYLENRLNRGVIARNDTIQITRGGGQDSYDILANDNLLFPDSTTINITDTVQMGSYTYQDGKVTYSVNDTLVGRDRLTYTIENYGGRDTAQVYFNVIPVEPPEDEIFVNKETLSSDTEGGISIHTADFDSDNDQDIVATLTDEANNGAIAWYPNAGDASFESKTTISNEVENPDHIRVADLNGDGNHDLVFTTTTSDTNMAWVPGNGDGTFGAPQSISTSSEIAEPGKIHVADINGNGNPDVITVNNSYSETNTVYWFPNTGEGSFGSRQSVSIEQYVGSRAIQPADIDGDGDVDLGSLSEDGDQLFWLPNKGDGTFEDRRMIDNWLNSPQYVTVSDLNNDGNPDVLTASSTDNAIYWYSNKGEGTFSKQQFVSSYMIGPSPVKITDVEGNGNVDVISFSNRYESVSLFRHAYNENGLNGSFDVRKRFGYQPGEDVPAISDVHVADINGDDKPDVITASRGASMSVFLNSMGSTGIAESSQQVPENYSLHANYPNPFNPTTQISYALPSASEVQLTVYDVLGREVKTLVDGKQSAGSHTVTFNGANLSTGVYIYRIKAGNYVDSNKMLLVK